MHVTVITPDGNEFETTVRTRDEIVATERLRRRYAHLPRTTVFALSV